MIRIAILDDEKEDLEKEAEITRKYFMINRQPVKLQLVKTQSGFCLV